MRGLLAIAAITTLLGTTGCRSYSAQVVSVDAPRPGTPELHVRCRVYRLWKHQVNCRVVAELAGYRAEALGVPMSEGLSEPEDVVSVITTWTPATDVPIDQVLRVSFFLKNRRLSYAQFPPPFDPRLLSMPPGGGWEQPPPAARNPLQRGGETRTTDLMRGQPPPQPPPSTTSGGESRTTDLMRPPPAAPCPVCQEPRGDASPCPHCGIE